MDASTIDLCLSVFPWAKFRQTKGAVKLHGVLDHDGLIPAFIDITDGKAHDVIRDERFVCRKAASGQWIDAIWITPGFMNWNNKAYSL